jgi:phosphatidylglycerophosphate synthase
VQRDLRTVADILTLSRVTIAVSLVALGIVYGKASFPAAVILAAIAWTTDALDGPVARRASRGPTWVSRADLPVDALLVGSTLLYLAIIHATSPWLILAYLTATGVAAWLYTAAIKVLNSVAHSLAVLVLLAQDPRLAFIVLLWAVVIGIARFSRLVQEVRTWFGILTRRDSVKRQAEVHRVT